jgi:hypothetical protein
VQNALGNFSNTYTLTTNTTLTGLQAGQFGIIGANGLTINLPACSDVPDGVVIALIGNGFGNTTIQRLGTDVISLGLNGSALSFVTLAPQDSIEFVKSGGVWIAYAGSAYLQGSSAFQHSNTSSGYIKLPGGLIMQWGVATISPNTTATINLATAWGTGMLNGHATFNSSPGGANDISKLIIMPLNSTQIHIAYNNSNAFGNNAAVYYFVIGR